MRKNVNEEIIEGRVYDHSLQMKKVTNKSSKNFGVDFISGNLNIATDEEGLNVIPVHYTFVTEFTKSGAVSSTFVNLKQILDGGKTWLKDGKDEALKVRLSTSAGLNDFFPGGGDQLVTTQKNEGGFVSFISELNPDERARKKFTFDVIINKVTIVPADPDHNIPEDFARINVAIFDFRNSLMPFTLIAKDSKAPGSVNYFLGLNASENNPVYTKVMGEITNTTIKVDKVMENAFGEAVVDSSSRHEREWIITWAQPNPYVFDTPDTITQAELQKAISDRNVYLEEQKAATKKYYAERNAAAAPSNAPMGIPTPSAVVPEGGFTF